MLAASHFLLWVSVILLSVAFVALERQVRFLRHGGAAFASGPLVAAIPLISTPTLSGEMVTIGGATRDGRPLLLLFLQADCIVSTQALQEAAALNDPARLRLILLGEGEASAFAALARPHRIREADIILSAGINAAMGLEHWPAAVLIAGDGTVLGRGGVRKRGQIHALLALLPSVAAPKMAPA